MAAVAAHRVGAMRSCSVLAGFDRVTVGDSRAFGRATGGWRGI